MSERGAEKDTPESTIRLVRGTPRITLWCPSGHEVLDTPLGSRAGQRFAVGDYSGEWCGTVGCGWSA
jgi:hypothetical protein